MDIRLDPAKALLALRRDGPALAAAASRAGLTAPVPSCPGWAVADLLRHTAELYAKWTVVVRDRLTDRPTDWARPPADDEDLFDYFPGRLAELVSVLRAADPATPVWTWYPPDRTVGFWCRRMAQETVVHRADAELATGEAQHVDAVVAVDGIDELLERFCVFGVSECGVPVRGGGRTVALLTADARWRLTLADDRLDLQRDAPPAGDATVAGTPSHLLFWLWGRADDGAVDLRGDRAALAELRRVLTAVTR